MKTFAATIWTRLLEFLVFGLAILFLLVALSDSALMARVAGWFDSSASSINDGSQPTFNAYIADLLGLGTNSLARTIPQNFSALEPRYDDL